MPFAACDADSLPVNHQLPRPGARDVAGDDRAFTARVSSYPPIVPESYKPLLTLTLILTLTLTLILTLTLSRRATSR